MICELLLRRMGQHMLPRRSTGLHVGIIGFRCLAVIPVLLRWRSRRGRWHRLLHILQRLLLHVNGRRIIVRVISIGVWIRGIPPRGHEERRPNKNMRTHISMNNRAANGWDMRTGPGRRLTANGRRVATRARWAGLRQCSPTGDSGGAQQTGRGKYLESGCSQRFHKGFENTI